MTLNLRLLLANRFPQLGRLKRRWHATLAAQRPVQHSYSQHGEDVYILSQLREYDLSHSLYVDVGANHPTILSNTYLLYRTGLHGVVVEPNSELLALHRQVRPRDVAVGVGCGRAPALAKFRILTTPVQSSFAPTSGAQAPAGDLKIWRTEYIPILPLDVILAGIDHSRISFLSVDTEGLDFDVLSGAEQTLTKTVLVCVEFDGPESRAKITDLMLGKGFSCTKEFGCNLIFLNQALAAQVKNESGLKMGVA